MTFEQVLALDSYESPANSGEGVTLLHAMRLYCPVEWAAIRAAWAEDHDGGGWVRAFDAGQRALREKLVAGVLDAGGVFDGARYEPLDRLMWTLPLKLFEPSSEIEFRIAAMVESSIEWSGPAVLGVRVFPTRRSAPRPASATDVRRWMREKRKTGYTWVSNQAALDDARRELKASVSMTRFLEAKKVAGDPRWSEPAKANR